MLSPRMTQMRLPSAKSCASRSASAMPPLPLLVRVVQLLEPELLAFAEQLQEAPGEAAAGDDHDVAHARVHQRFDGIEHHRAIIDRQQMLVGDFRAGKQPAAEAAGQDDALHREALPSVGAAATQAATRAVSTGRNGPGPASVPS